MNPISFSNGFTNTFTFAENPFIPSPVGHANSFTMLEGNVDPSNSTLSRGILPTSSEYDMMRERYFQQDGVVRTDWYSRMLGENPDIREFIERVDPIARSTTFARLYLPSNRLVSQNVLLSLISQHLRTLGLVESQSSIHDEWDELVQIPAHLTYSQLALIIQRGITRSERFWELSMPSPCNVETPGPLLDEEISRTIGGTPYVAEDATPLTSEKQGDPQFYKVDENGEPCEVSLNQLIWLLAPENESERPQSTELINAICLTYKSFTTSKLFFTKVRERFRCAFSEENESDRSRSIAVTLKLLKAWLKDDSIEQPVLDAVRAFVETELRPHAPNYCDKLFDQNKIVPETTMIDYSRAPKVQLGNCINLWQSDFSLFQLPPEEFARQMTIYSSTYFYAISRSELLDNVWTIPRFKHRAPNVCALTQYMNRVTGWVQRKILNEPNLNARLEKMTFLINVMKHLETMENYFDLTCIFGGFNSPPVFRLGVHKKLLSSDTISTLQRIDKFENDLPSIRTIHNNANLTRTPKLPRIPLLLGDLCLFNEATKALVNGLINLKKCKRMLTLIQQFEQFKRNKYCFLPIEQVQTKLHNLKVFDDDSLQELSYDVEPEGAGEKSQLKDGPRRSKKSHKS